MSIYRALDAEFKRVARQEDKPMSELVAEIVSLTDYSERQLYNFRSGKWPVPADLIPVLCGRFQSRSLLHALVAEIGQVGVQSPGEQELARLYTDGVRRAMDHYSLLLSLFEQERVSAGDLDRLKESGDSVAQSVAMFYEIARSKVQEVRA